MRAWMAHRVCKRPFRDVNPDFKSWCKILSDALTEVKGLKGLHLLLSRCGSEGNVCTLKQVCDLCSRSSEVALWFAYNKTHHRLLSYSMVCGVTPSAQQQSPVTVRDSHMPELSPFADDQWQHWVCCCDSASPFEVTCRDWVGPRWGSWRLWKLASLIGGSVKVTQTSIPSLPTPSLPPSHLLASSHLCLEIHKC